MDCKINWTPEALATYEANIEYLELYWTTKEISNFILLADAKILNLFKHPKLGRVIN